jgi:hypothetical protein
MAEMSREKCSPQRLVAVATVTRFLHMMNDVVLAEPLTPPSAPPLPLSDPAPKSQGEALRFAVADRRSALLQRGADLFRDEGGRSCRSTLDVATKRYSTAVCA